MPTETIERPLVDEVNRVFGAAARLRAAVTNLDPAEVGDDVVALVALIGLELSLTNAEVAAAAATTIADLTGALEEVATASRAWLVDPAVTARLDRVGSRAHASSVELRIAGAAAEADRGVAVALAAAAGDFERTRDTATRLVRRIRQACFDAALSVVFG